ncbi:hypothetical protein ACH5RR_000610 [Cinchona calisaya]|uniref:Neprosin PEP catalytic domain-containing protein n=1 Tax=Cinchona calisaya TaxID=153742 RepID=A0ABD3B271_9GENT
MGGALTEPFQLEEQHEDLVEVSSIKKKLFRPQASTVDEGIHENAGVYTESGKYIGVEATINLCNPKVQGKDFSLSQIWLIEGSGIVDTNAIEVGWISPDGDIIDCVLISHQPAFDHPLLKNHTIQMRPNYHPEELFGDGTKKSDFEPYTEDDITKPVIQLWHLNGRCPKGTVPVRRTKQEDINKTSSGNSFVKKRRKSFSQLPLATKLLNPTAHEHSYATVQSNVYYGTQATINVWNPPVQDSNEFSLSQIWILGGPDSNLNTIEAGWISDDYQSTGCYNLQCSGFVQTNNNVALGGTITPFSTYEGSQFEITILVWKDPKQNLWWLKYGTEIIGYWPTSLFQYLTESASLIEWGGEIINNKLNGQHTTTKMGSGHFAEEGYQGASYFRNLQVVDGSNTLRPPGLITVIAEQPNCYNILLQNNSDWGDYFFYGGPGRNPNCP